MQPQEILSRRIDYQFVDPTLLSTALTHRSASNHNNERMEFLGDSILSYIISIELYERFPTAQEGELSRVRASLVKGETLAKIARELSLGDFLALGSGEMKSGGFRRSSILADAYEALIGAIFLDGGLEAARNFVLKFFTDRLAKCDPDSINKDPKTRLQEYLQARSLELPDYKVVSITGEAHKQFFKVECHLPLMEKPFLGEGTSRRKAEQMAAENALEKLEV
ncbi:MAG: ribonuclease III [Gammaproteobacteria bacterium]|nr:ribonuclease III [Gammaproteobacteria bacterium]MDH5652609.1 ribonuclease III [Gammaproteobacteria bacterium]